MGLTSTFQSAHGPLTKGRATHFSACRLEGEGGVDQHFSAHGPLTKGRATHFSACRLEGEGGVDQHFSAPMMVQKPK